MSKNRYTLFGYRLQNGEVTLHEREAEAVKLIYSEYLRGQSLKQIAGLMTIREIPYNEVSPVWNKHMVKRILDNPKYTGSAQYPALVTEAESEHIHHSKTEKYTRKAVCIPATAESLKDKSFCHECGSRLCGDCGTRYRRVTWARGGKKKIVWRCINRLEYGTKYCKDSPTIEEYRLQDAIVRAFNVLAKDKDEVISTLKDSLRKALATGEDTIDKTAIESRIRELQAVMLDLVQVSAKSSSSADFFEDKFKEISDEIKVLQERLQCQEQRQTAAQNTSWRIGEIFTLLENEDLNLTEYDEVLVRRLIEEIKVLSEDKVLVVFNGGMEVEMEL